MLKHGIQGFTGKRVLLLQGPVGPFFSRLAQDLEQVGATVHKVNFHAGDWLFYPRKAIAFRQPTAQWPVFFVQLLDSLQIDVVLLFGDCRPIHVVARRLADARGVEVGVFEEGYLRPAHITLERNGVNGHSALPRSALYYLNQPDLPSPGAQPVPSPYWHMIWWGFGYFTIGALGKPWFRHYQHHRRLNILEALPWLRSIWRKQWYRWKERNMQTQLAQQWNGRFFLVPLQVYNDTQIGKHSDFASVDNFMEVVAASFAENAPADVALVFKHHPMDRGYVDYTLSIAERTKRLGLNGRCFYLHDQHLPTLLDHAAGVVVVNSTVGLQALSHGVPVKTMGQAIYDMQGLTYQSPLDSFWQEAQAVRPNKRLLKQFVNYLKCTSQINGSFYRAMKGTAWKTGVSWPLEGRLPALPHGQGKSEPSKRPMGPAMSASDLAMRRGAGH
jgi:capsular polysaccharide export protein